MKLFLSGFSVFGTFLIMFSLITNVWGNIFLYSILFDIEDLPDSKDIVVTYKVGWKRDDLNRIYAKSNKLKINDEQYYKRICFSDLDNIADCPGVKKILLSDTEYIYKIFDEIKNAYREDRLPDDLYIFSMPHELLAFVDKVEMPCDVTKIIRGRLPYNNSNEVVISNELLKKYFDIDEENPIGKKIVLNNKDYTIVGLWNNHLCMVSFDDSDNYGYFVYNKDNGKERINRIMKYLEQENYDITDEARNTVIYTDANYEKKVLDWLIVNYPADHYVSYEYCLFKKNYMNRRGMFILCGFNIIFALFSCAIIVNILKISFIILAARGIRFDNFYGTYNRTSDLFTKTAFKQYIICFIIVIALSVGMHKQTSHYLLINAIVNIIIFLFARLRGKS